MAGKALTPEQNARLRALIRKLQMRPEYANQTVLAEKLGVRQPTLSAFMSSERQGSSVHVIEAACALDGETNPGEILGFKGSESSKSNPNYGSDLPDNVAEAVRRAHFDGIVSQRAIDSVLSEHRVGGLASVPARDLVADMEAAERRLNRPAPPPTDDATKGEEEVAARIAARTAAKKLRTKK